MIRLSLMAGIATLAMMTMTAIPSAQADEAALAALEKAREAFVAQWLKTPLSIRKAFFVAKPAGGFGMYEQRPDSVFKPGEKLLVYAEPVGYRWGRADGRHVIAFSIDAALSTTSGKILWGQKNFMKMGLSSHERNTGFMAALTYNFTGLPAGDYVLDTTMNDVVGGGKASFSLPFSVRK